MEDKLERICQSRSYGWGLYRIKCFNDKDPRNRNQSKDKEWE